MKNFLNTRFIYYKGGLILYKKYLVGKTFKVQVKLFYMLNLTTIFKTDDKYSLNDNNSLGKLISCYKKVIDGYNNITKTKD